MNNAGEAHLRSAALPLYDEPLSASRSGPLYNAFPYPTKISPEAIALFIATHTKPGDTVLDTFAGSGTTGLASLLCSRPTPYMLARARDLGLDCAWGPRKAYLYELGVLGSFVSKALTHPPKPADFQKAAAALIAEAQQRLGDLYVTADPNGNPGTIRHVIWSDVIRCAVCAGETTFWRAAVRWAPLALNKMWNCPSCGTEASLESAQRVYEKELDVFGRSQELRKRIPVEVHGSTGAKKWKRPAQPSDHELSRLLAGRELPSSAPDAEIVWGDLHRSGYHRGISHLHHLYTPRNFLAISTCLEIAREYPEPLRSSLELLVLSYNAAHATLMTRVVIKTGQKDLALTSAQSGVLYVSSLPVEKNVLPGLARKARTLSAAFELVERAVGSVEVVNSTSEKLNILDESIDYVFTDPPFGGYIPYAELNQVSELWIGNVTDRRLETIVSRAAGKTEESYRTSLTQVFSEIARVLKPQGSATVVFHSAHSAIWAALTNSFNEAGLSVERTSILDKMQASFKQVVSGVSVKGDPLILLSKQFKKTVETTSAEVFDLVLGSAQDPIDLRSLFSKYAATCLQSGVPVELDAELFQRLAAERLQVAA